MMVRRAVKKVNWLTWVFASSGLFLNMADRVADPSITWAQVFQPYVVIFALLGGLNAFLAHVSSSPKDVGEKAVPSE